MARRVDDAYLHAIDVDDVLVIEHACRSERVVLPSAARDTTEQLGAGALDEHGRCRRVIDVRVRDQHHVDATGGLGQESLDMRICDGTGIDDGKSAAAQDVSVGSGASHVAGIVRDESTHAWCNLIELSGAE